MNSHEESAIALFREIINSNLLSESLTKECVAEIRSLQRGMQKTARLLDALKGVVRVADRKTVEFDAARAAIAEAESQSPANATT